LAHLFEGLGMQQVTSTSPTSLCLTSPYFKDQQRIVSHLIITLVNYHRETDKVLFGGIYPIIFPKYPIMFNESVTKSIKIIDTQLLKFMWYRKL